MSCLNLKFPPARKAWKIFTNKIRRRLRILPTTKKKSVYLPVRNRVPLRLSFQRSGVQRPRRCTFKRKRRSPVFVDGLFGPTLDATILEHGHRAIPVKSGTSRSIKMMEGSTDAEAGTSEAFVEVGEGGGSGDDMWESMAIASPLMRRIDERAEEFINKFRAEMAAGDL